MSRAKQDASAVDMLSELTAFTDRLLEANASVEFREINLSRQKTCGYRKSKRLKDAQEKLQSTIKELESTIAEARKQAV